MEFPSMVAGSQGECEGASGLLFRQLWVSADKVQGVWMKLLLLRAPWLGAEPRWMDPTLYLTVRQCW